MAFRYAVDHEAREYIDTATMGPSRAAKLANALMEDGRWQKRGLAVVDLPPDGYTEVPDKS